MGNSACCAHPDAELYQSRDPDKHNGDSDSRHQKKRLLRYHKGVNNETDSLRGEEARGTQNRLLDLDRNDITFVYY